MYEKFSYWPRSIDFMTADYNSEEEILTLSTYEIIISNDSVDKI